ncbi:MAG: prohibitin family protein, partial [Thermoprotei archaeon]
MAEIPVRVPAGEKVRVVAAIVVPLLIVIVVISALSVYQVGLGEVAIVIDPIFQRLGRPVVGPAIAFKPPWAYVVKDYIGVEAIDMFFEPPRDYPAIRALTQDGVLVEVDVTIRYRVIPENFDKLVKAYPRLNYEEDFLVATARQ